MRNLWKLGILVFITKLAFAGGGGTANLVVSSGTYQAVSLYTNDDGGSRQAIILGNRTSSATATIDDVTGMRVSLSTSALTTLNGVKIEAGQTAIPIVSTNTLTVSGTVTAVPGTVAYPIVSTNTLLTSASQTGTWTVQPGNTANTTAWKVDGSAVTQPVSGTVTAVPGTVAYPIVSTNTLNVSAAQSGTWNIGTVTTLTNGTVVVNAGVTAIPIVSTNTLNVAGSFSSNNLSTGTINAAVPNVATMVGAQGLGGNLSSFRVDASSYLYVNVAAGGAAGGTSSTFGATFPGPGTAAGFYNPASGLMQAGRVDTSSNVVVTPGQVAFPIISTTTLNVSGSFSASSLSTGAINSATPGVATYIGALGVGGNLSPFKVDGSSSLYVTPGIVAFPIVSTNTLTVSGTVTAIPGTVAYPIVSTNTLNVSATQSGVWSVSNSTNAVMGDVASGSTDSGNPVKQGGIGRTTYQTAVTDGQRVAFQGDSEGKQVMMPYAVPALSTSGVTAAMTGVTLSVLISSGGANINTYLGHISCFNSHATVSTVINIYNGATVRYTGYAVAAGGGFTANFPTPLAGASNTQWGVEDATTGSNIYCNATGYFAKN